VEILGSGPPEAIRSLRLSPQQVLELQGFLHGFILFHLGKVPPGRPAALGNPD
jgi:hypothetical protein